MRHPVTMTLLINGQFFDNTFSEWIFHRANLLNLAGWVKNRSDELIEVRVSGDQILIEALEVACSLGPFDVHVDSIEILQETAPHQGSSFQQL